MVWQENFGAFKKCLSPSVGKGSQLFPKLTCEQSTVHKVYST